MSVKRTERGWPGHFIAANFCTFRRNTLLEYGEKKWVISTVGAYFPMGMGQPESIGANRWYETMVFEATLQGGYWDADVEKGIDVKGDWGIWGETKDEVIEKYGKPDAAANDMHERIVEEMTEKIQEMEQEERK